MACNAKASWCALCQLPGDQQAGAPGGTQWQHEPSLLLLPSAALPRPGPVVQGRRRDDVPPAAAAVAPHMAPHRTRAPPHLWQWLAAAPTCVACANTHAVRTRRCRGLVQHRRRPQWDDRPRHCGARARQRRTEGQPVNSATLAGTLLHYGGHRVDWPVGRTSTGRLGSRLHGIGACMQMAGFSVSGQEAACACSVTIRRLLYRRPASTHVGLVHAQQAGRRSAMMMAAHCGLPCPPHPNRPPLHPTSCHLTALALPAPLTCGLMVGLLSNPPPNQPTNRRRRAQAGPCPRAGSTSSASGCGG